MPPENDDTPGGSGVSTARPPQDTARNANVSTPRPIPTVEQCKAEGLVYLVFLACHLGEPRPDQLASAAAALGPFVQDLFDRTTRSQIADGIILDLHHENTELKQTLVGKVGAFHPWVQKLIEQLAQQRDDANAWAETLLADGLKDAAKIRRLEAEIRRLEAEKAELKRLLKKALTR